MKLQPLYDLQQEINRLFIAGSKFAKGDPRLQKHVPILNKLGEKAPVFSKLAKDVEELADTDAQQSPEKLMSISVLLYSILYTQGEAVEAGVEEKPQTPNFSLDEVNTEFSYFQLKPAIEALTTSNSGRMELIKEAHEKGVFKDSRTYMYVDKALGDKYADLTHWIVTTLIPLIGEPLIPVLLKSFDYADTAEEARRLKALIQLDAPQLPEIIEKVITERIPNLVLAAIPYLAKDAKNEDLLLEFAKDKQKDVRVDAYFALRDMKSEKGWEYMVNLFLSEKKKADLSMLSRAFAAYSLPARYVPLLIEKAQKSFDSFIEAGNDSATSDKGLQEKLDYLYMHVESLIYKEYQEIYDFFDMLLNSKEYNTLIGKNKGLLEYKARNITDEILRSVKDDKKYEVWDKLSQNVYANTYWNQRLTDDYFGYCAENSVLSKEAFYNRFAEYYKSDAVLAGSIFHDFGVSKKDSLEGILDTRWKPLLLNKLKEDKYYFEYILETYVKLIGIDTPEAKELIISGINDHALSIYKFDSLSKIMQQTQHPDRFDIILDALVARNKKQKITSYQLRVVKFEAFPKEYIQKMQDLHEKTKEDIYAQVAELMQNG
ncbi:MAG: HEAT repeat domain-containing protein [Dysgonomonas sp.]|nr:HEAT repeat domain-containing protein [Dysgonomonas sp.]